MEAFRAVVDLAGAHNLEVNDDDVAVRRAQFDLANASAGAVNFSNFEVVFSGRQRVYQHRFPEAPLPALPHVRTLLSTDGAWSFPKESRAEQFIERAAPERLSARLIALLGNSNLRDDSVSDQILFEQTDRAEFQIPCHGSGAQRHRASLRLPAGAREIGIEGTVRHHLKWTGRYPELATYLTHCQEPEVAEASEARAQEPNRAFFEQTGAWLIKHVQDGKVRRLPPSLYYALWMGPSDEFTRLWLLGPRPREAKQLAKAENLLASTAWENLKARRIRSL